MANYILSKTKLIIEIDAIQYFAAPRNAAHARAGGIVPQFTQVDPTRLCDQQRIAYQIGKIEIQATTLEAAYNDIADVMQSEMNIRQASNAVIQARIEANQVAIYKEVRSAIDTGTVMESTIENIGKVLNFLNQQNWGGWDLPKMSIGYKCAQYDCDGKRATTMTLNYGVTDEDFGCENETRFVVGNPRGHLNKYRSIRI